MNLLPSFSVSECVELINNHLDLLGSITVIGEISRIDVKNGRLVFVTVKDNKSALDVFGLTHQIRNLNQLELGMEVEVIATAGLYKNSGRFRLFTQSITPHGEGALNRALEKLRELLESEGLFDADRKRPLPEWPQNIALVTAKESSAYHDLVSIISSRMRGLTLSLLPVTVQGPSAPSSIISALEYINHHYQDFDMVILARGGGSQEDLAAFNQEDVARAVYGCKAPIISAIGHEDNHSLTDDTADARATTPTHAAEMAVKDRHEVIYALKNTFIHHRRLLSQKMTEYHDQQSRYTQRLGYSLRNTLDRAIYSNLGNKTKLVNLVSSLIRSLKIQLNDKQKKLVHLNNALNLLDHEKILTRGFSITRDQNQRILRSVSATSSGETIYTQLRDGTISSIIKS